MGHPRCPNTIIPGEMVAKPYHSTPQSPYFLPDLCIKLCRGAASSQKLGHKTFWGDMHWNQLPGMTHCKDWVKRMEDAERNGL